MDDNNKIKLIICISIFIIAIVLVLFNRATPSKKNTPVDNTPTIIDQIKNINESNYQSEVHFILDDDAIYLNYQKINNIEIGEKRYHNIITNYIKRDDEYYSYDNQVVTKLENFTNFEYDKTYIDIKFLKEVLELKEENMLITDNLLTINYNTFDAIRIYNKINNTNYILNDKEFIVKIYYTDNKIDKIVLDLTDIYNKINNKNYKEVICEYTYKEENEEDISWLEEMLP